jgi:hypothetical protein
MNEQIQWAQHLCEENATQLKIHERKLKKDPTDASAEALVRFTKNRQAQLDEALSKLISEEKSSR